MDLPPDLPEPLQRRRSQPLCGAVVARPVDAVPAPSLPGAARVPLARRAVAQVGPLAVQDRACAWVCAGLGARALAGFIDFVVLNVAMTLVNVVFLAVLLAGLNMTTILVGTLGPVVAGAVITTLYSVGLEASAWQGTLGKRMLGLRVMTLDGGRLSLWRAASRNAGKGLSGLLLGLGYLMALCTTRRQALHDVLARCVVVRHRCGPA